MQLIILGLFILLSSCSSTTTNFYPETVGSWHGATVEQLQTQWGTPDEKIPAEKGQILYVYKMQSYRVANNPTAPEIGVNVNGGRPVITSTPSTNHTWTRGGPSVTCLTIFVINAYGKIVDVKNKGNSCFGNENFMHTKKLVVV